MVMAYTNGLNNLLSVRSALSYALATDEQRKILSETTVGDLLNQPFVKQHLINSLQSINPILEDPSTTIDCHINHNGLAWSYQLELNLQNQFANDVSLTSSNYQLGNINIHNHLKSLLEDEDFMMDWEIQILENFNYRKITKYEINDQQTSSFDIKDYLYQNFIDTIYNDLLYQLDIKPLWNSNVVNAINDFLNLDENQGHILNQLAIHLNQDDLNNVFSDIKVSGLDNILLNLCNQSYGEVSISDNEKQYLKMPLKDILMLKFLTGLVEDGQYITPELQEIIGSTYLQFKINDEEQVQTHYLLDTINNEFVNYSADISVNVGADSNEISNVNCYLNCESSGMPLELDQTHYVRQLSM